MSVNSPSETSNTAEPIASPGNLFNRVRKRVYSITKPVTGRVQEAQNFGLSIARPQTPLKTPTSQDHVWSPMIETPEMRNMHNIFYEYAVKRLMTAEMKVARMGLLEKLRFVLCNEKRRDKLPSWSTMVTNGSCKISSTFPLCPLPAARASFVDAMSSELTLHLSRTISCITWFECPTELFSLVVTTAKEIASSPFLDYLCRRGPSQLMSNECPLTTVATWIIATSPPWMRILITSTNGIDRASRRSQLRRELQIVLNLNDSDLVAPAFAHGLERVATIRRRLMARLDDIIQRKVALKRWPFAPISSIKEHRLERQAGKKAIQLRRLLGIQAVVTAGYEYKELGDHDIA